MNLQYLQINVRKTNYLILLINIDSLLGIVNVFSPYTYLLRENKMSALILFTFNK